MAQVTLNAHIHRNYVSQPDVDWYYSQVITSSCTDAESYTAKGQWVTAPRSKSGFRPYTPYSASGVKYTLTNGTTKHVDTGGTGQYRYTETRIADTTVTSCSIGALPSAPPLSSYSRQGLLTQALADAKEQAFDVTTNLGELPETVAMLVSFKRRLGESVMGTVREYLRRNRHRPLNQVLRDLYDHFNSIWLEIRYGWRPLVSSIQDLNGALERVRGGENTVCVGAARHQKMLTSPTFTYAQYPYAGSNFYRQTMTTVRRTEAVYRASVAIEMSPFDASFTSNPLSTVWELIPASFLVDWGVRVGDFLRALGTDTQLAKNVTACTSTEVKFKASVRPSEPYPSAYNTVITPLAFDVEKFSYVRVVESVIIPTLTLNTSNLSIPQMIDLSAIIRQVLRSR